jgi:uncharacterized protein YndB with AHSA1/START domain
MENTTKPVITIESIINSPIEKVWDCWTLPEHIMQWNNASEDWHCPEAINDLQSDGKFSYKMAAKDGSFAFDFGGTYNTVIINEYISYTLDDDRKVSVSFTQQEDGIKVVESFEAENMNSLELQQAGWQSILNNFKKHTEAA